MRDMAKKAAYDRAYLQRRRNEIKATGRDICGYCWRQPCVIGKTCAKCRKARNRWMRTRYLKRRPGAGLQSCGHCGDEGHNARTCRWKVARCACGLMLPCDCAEMRLELASSRRGDSTGLVRP